MDKVLEEELENLIGDTKLNAFYTICNYINDNYKAEHVWNDGGKKWDYEYKFRKSSKTLCAFYFKQGCLGFMIIFGKKERDYFEQNKDQYSKQICKLYNSTTTYHDGKWLMIEIEDLKLFEDIKKLLLIKRKPNIK